MDHAIARIYMVKHLAGVLSRCVECTVSPRAELDWRTAEQIVDQKPWAVQKVAATLSDDDSYTVFEKKCGRDAFALYQYAQNSLPKPAYGEILFS